jgi:hypothetical protein
MFTKTALIVAGALFTLSAAESQTVSRAYIGKDKKAHVVYGTRTVVVPPEEKQVDCEAIQIAGDKRTVGWSVLVENCCTSYPIPTSVVIMVAGKKTVITPGMMIFEWHFEARGERVAMLIGPVHGDAAGANLYEPRSGKLVDSWKSGDQ